MLYERKRHFAKEIKDDFGIFTAINVVNECDDNYNVFYFNLILYNLNLNLICL